jgi:hypothetical protein
MINYFKKIVGKIRATIVKVAKRKHFLDFLVATLTIPVLLTILITNIMTLQSKSADKTTTTTGGQIVNKEAALKNTLPIKTSENTSASVPISSESCKKEIGPINISSPKENEIIVDNPVCITIKYDNENYCSVVWSYRINGGSWSEYSSNSVCLYDVSTKNVKFDLRVQSTVSNEQTSLTRNFVYEGTKSSSSSATTQ